MYPNFSFLPSFLPLSLCHSPLTISPPALFHHVRGHLSSQATNQNTIESSIGLLSRAVNDNDLVDSQQSIIRQGCNPLPILSTWSGVQVQVYLPNLHMSIGAQDRVGKPRQLPSSDTYDDSGPSLHPVIIHVWRMCNVETTIAIPVR